MIYQLNQEVVLEVLRKFFIKFSGSLWLLVIGLDGSVAFIGIIILKLFSN